ncbi:hypothetical protein CY34DRAFT_689852 [Suillus luteus UH-Slu-Lm8-n1]|uniref:Uncharacterized protein n=1 Tax=Suillus luteus UH-Slu-Lm8-n1 TaxID=930992 RepID=A0A0D0BBK3_9AGAM|nr:hypothetical protein CY34DRAFT_689852 [Suillus luteus UH-Slu-Lm8-n1]
MSSINTVLLVYAPWGDSDCFTTQYCRLGARCWRRRPRLGGCPLTSYRMCRIHSQVLGTRWRWDHHMLPEMCVHPQSAKFSTPPLMRRRIMTPKSSCSHMH